MAEINFKLPKGYQIGDEVLHDVVMRELNTGDIIQSQIEAEQIVTTVDGPVLVTSPALAGAHLLRRQIVRIGNVQGPLSLVELQRLELDDFELIQFKANELDQARARRLAKENSNRGRTDQGESVG